MGLLLMGDSALGVCGRGVHEAQSPLHSYRGDVYFPSGYERIVL